MEQDRESLIRVNSRGVVVYRAEENELIRRLPDNIQRLRDFHVPQSGCCYSRFYAQHSQTNRPTEVFHEKSVPSQKPNVSQLLQIIYLLKLCYFFFFRPASNSHLATTSFKT